MRQLKAKEKEEEAFQKGSAGLHKKKIYLHKRAQPYDQGSRVACN
jgi:hypothetical protein